MEILDAYSRLECNCNRNCHTKYHFASLKQMCNFCDELWETTSSIFFFNAKIQTNKNKQPLSKNFKHYQKTHWLMKMWMKSSTFRHLLSTLEGIIEFSGWCRVAPGCDHCALLRVWAQVSGVFLRLCSFVKHCRLPVWWMLLFVAQVRRHPWWDRPTVHHSPASTLFPPLLRGYPLHLHPFSPFHSSCTWQMTHTRNAFYDIYPFFLH